MLEVGVLKTEGERGTGNPIVTDTYKKLWILNLYENMSRAQRCSHIINQFLLLFDTGFLPARTDVRIADSSVVRKK